MSGIVKLAKALGLKVAPQEEALRVAQENAVKMLGLPPGNTPAQRAAAMQYVRDDAGQSYRMAHQAPVTADDFGAPAHALDRMYPADIYSRKAAEYYGEGRPYDARTVALLQALKNKPDSLVNVYRAVPKGAQKTLQHGDWVTPSKEYAKEHGLYFKEGADIISEKVPAKSLITEGNSLHEFGFDRGQTFADAPASVPIMRSKNKGMLERSPFAAFDPARINENNLLASRLLPFALPGLLALPQDE